MGLFNYLNKKVRLNLTNGFYYDGEILEVTDDDITIKDKFGKLVTMRVSMVSVIKEVSDGTHN